VEKPFSIGLDRSGIKHPFIPESFDGHVRKGHASDDSG